MVSLPPPMTLTVQVVEHRGGTGSREAQGIVISDELSLTRTMAILPSTFLTTPTLPLRKMSWQPGLRRTSTSTKWRGTSAGGVATGCCREG